MLLDAHVGVHARCERLVALAGGVLVSQGHVHVGVAAPVEELRESGALLREDREARVPEVVVFEPGDARSLAGGLIDCLLSVRSCRKPHYGVRVATRMAENATMWALVPDWHTRAISLVLTGSVSHCPTRPAQPWQHWFYTSGAWIGPHDWKNHRGPLTHDQRRLAHIAAALALTLAASATASALLWHWTNPPLPPPGPATTTGGYPTGPDSNPTPSPAPAPTPPAPPAGNDHNTPNGAQVTAYHALALADYTWNTGDTTPLHDISAPECQWCAQTTTDTTTTYTTGGWAANAWHTNTNPTTTTTNTTTTNTYTTTLTTTQRTPDIYARGAMTPHVYRTTTVKVDLRWDGNRWLLAELVPLHASGADPSDPDASRPAPSHSGAPRSAPPPTSPRSAPSPSGAPAGIQTPTPPEPGSSAPGTGGPGGPSTPEPTATSWSQSPPAPDDPRAEPDPTDPSTADRR